MHNFSGYCAPGCRLIHGNWQKVLESVQIFGWSVDIPYYTSVYLSYVSMNFHSDLGRYICDNECIMYPEIVENYFSLRWY